MEPEQKKRRVDNDTLARHVLECRNTPNSCLSFQYKMDGKLTGRLDLMNQKDLRQCSWRSERTRLSTDWHGEWFELADDKLRVHFDCFGKKTRGEKWTTLTIDDLSCHGNDQYGREIHVEFIGIYILDEVALRFVFRPS